MRYLPPKSSPRDPFLKRYITNITVLVIAIILTTIAYFAIGILFNITRYLVQYSEIAGFIFLGFFLVLFVALMLTLFHVGED